MKWNVKWVRTVIVIASLAAMALSSVANTSWG